MTTSSSTSENALRRLDMTHLAGEDVRTIVPYVLACCLVLPGCRQNSESPQLPTVLSGSVPELVRLLRADDPARRAQAAHALGEKGAEAKEAVPELAKLLKDSEVRVRLEAAVALGKLGPEARAAVPELIQALTDKETTVRRQAAAALGRIGPDAKAALPALEKAKTDAAPIVRKAAEDAVKGISGTRR
jgi:HEAT repeat protein